MRGLTGSQWLLIEHLLCAGPCVSCWDQADEVLPLWSLHFSGVMDHRPGRRGRRRGRQRLPMKNQTVGRGGGVRPAGSTPSRRPSGSQQTWPRPSLEFHCASALQRQRGGGEPPLHPTVAATTKVTEGEPWQVARIPTGPEALQSGSEGWCLALVPLDVLLCHPFSPAGSGMLRAVCISGSWDLREPSLCPRLICIEPCATKSN